LQAIYIAKRLSFIPITLLGISIVAFILFRIVPGDPLRAMLPPNATVQEIESFRKEFDLTGPIYVQYLIWLKNAVVGNFGTSIQYNQPVLPLILARLPITLQLVITSELLALIVGIFLGTQSAVRKNRLLKGFAGTFTFLGFAIPDYLWGIIFVVLFGAILKVLPVVGDIDVSINLTTVTGFPILDSILTGNLPALGSSIEHLVLPATALALPQIAAIQRTIRSGMLDVTKEDYILTDRAKGLAQNYIYYVRAFKNALIPTVTLTAVQFTFVLGGSVLIELVFGLPGIGNLAFIAVEWRDLPLIQGIVVVYAIIVVVTSFAIDMLYTFLNPKIRYG